MLVVQIVSVIIILTFRWIISFINVYTFRSINLDVMQQLHTKITVIIKNQQKKWIIKLFGKNGTVAFTFSSSHVTTKLSRVWFIHNFLNIHQFYIFVTLKGKYLNSIYNIHTTYMAYMSFQWAFTYKLTFIFFLFLFWIKFFIIKSTSAITWNMF